MSNENRENDVVQVNSDTETYVIRLSDFYNPFHLTESRKRHLRELLTKGGRNPNMTNVILDITDVPISRDTFNNWLLTLIKETDLTVVDNSMEVEFESGHITYKKADGTEKETFMEIMQYPYSMNFEEHGFDRDDFTVKHVIKRVGKPYVTDKVGVYEEATTSESFKFYARHVKTPVRVRQDVIEQVIISRDIRKEVKSLADFCDVDEKGQKVFTLESIDRATDHIETLMESGQTVRVLFGTYDIPVTEESALNIAKLFILAHGMLEMDRLSSTQELCTKYTLPYVSQLTYDYSSYNAFVEDFMNRHARNSRFIMCKNRGIFETAIIEDYSVLKVGNGLSKCYIKIAYNEFGQNLVEEEIELLQFYSLNRIALPLGYADGSDTDLNPLEERTKFFDKPLSEFKEFEEKVQINGISPFIGTNIHYDAKTDYVNVFRLGLEQEYKTMGLGPLPEIDLKEIIKGADSPYSHKYRSIKNKEV